MSDWWQYVLEDWVGLIAVALLLCLASYGLCWGMP